ncbi:MAG TPA: selenocysteine-specific translation elongation factor [Stellaceae bacterium]|jgi:selenocysteine-specific elongation factor|nr:selenocysteine-specific translation elongation factor [Stellaceae bacterium]
MILATAGHIDHGKTALVRALTGVDADRLPEEKKRGLTIDLGFAYATLPDGAELGFVDVPGHERFLPNMLAGVLSIDRVLLVVAADDGPRPQTIEHLDILELIEVGEITVIVTKIDRVPAERTAAVAAEVAKLLAEAGHPASPVFPVSSHSGAGIAALTRHLQENARIAGLARAAAPPAGLFRMAIDRAFSLPGIGLVVTGTVSAGRVAPGDRLTVTPRGIPVRVRGLHAQNHAIETAGAGERCAVNIVGSFPEGAEPRRGDWLVAPARHLPVRRIDLLMRASRHAEVRLRDGLPVHLHLGAEDVVGRAAVLSGRVIAPGETGYVQIDLDQPIGALHGDRAVLRDHGARTTLAGGRVVDPLAPRRGRRLPQRLELLDAMARADPATALQQMLALVGVVDLAQFALVRNLTTAELDALTDGTEFLRVGPAQAPVAVTREHSTTLVARIVEALAVAHQAQPDMLGPTRAALFAQLRGTPEAALDAALAELAAAGSAVREGGMWRLPEHRPRLTNADEKLWSRMRPLLAAAELRPPRVREVADALALDPEAVERFLNRAARLGRVAKVADNRFFLPQTVAHLAGIARDLAATAPQGAFTAVAFNARTGVGRNLTIQILEYLDKIGATRRVGDARVAAEAFG